MFKKTFLFLVLVSASFHLQAQFGYGMTANVDLYQRYTNPDKNEISPSAGNALLNLGLGPKIWLGGKKVSFSAEAMAVLGMTGFSTKDYKGMGMVAIPIMGKLNFNGLSTFDREGALGWNVGGGVQYNRTEAYGLSDEYAQKGITRDYFKTIIAQVGYGYGISGFTMQGFVRYGWNPDNNARTLNIGLISDFNIPMLRKITNPESAL